MFSELWFYFMTVLISTGYALLMQSYPKRKMYLSIGFLAFVIGGAVLIYFDAKEKEEGRTKMAQMERKIEDAKKETQKQETATKEATKRAELLAQQLTVRAEAKPDASKEVPNINGEIRKVRLFPWQRTSSPQRTADDKATTMGILVFARIENHGSSTTLAHWELNIELADSTVIKPQKWPASKKLRIQCEEGSIDISKDEYLDAGSKKSLQKAEERSGVTVWMVRDVRPHTIQGKDSVYTLTARDITGVLHALERFTLVSLPQKCFGFDVLD